MTQTQLKSPHPARDWPFQVIPLHPVLGCEIIGITLAQAVSPAIFAKVYEAFLDYQLILFRDVDLSPTTLETANRALDVEISAGFASSKPFRVVVLIMPGAVRAS